jgi:hypothetical protein
VEVDLQAGELAGDPPELDVDDALLALNLDCICIMLFFILHLASCM